MTGSRAGTTADGLRDRVATAADRVTATLESGYERVRDALGLGPDRVQVLVHPTFRFVGGEYDPPTARTGMGGVWAAAVDRAVEAFDGDSVALANLVRPDGRSVYVDGPPPAEDPEGAHTESTTVAGDHVHIPYGHGRYDAVFNDPYGGDLPAEAVEATFGGYDEMVVRGAYYTNCERDLVESVVETLGDEIDVTVDATLSAAWVEERVGGWNEMPGVRRDHERRTARAPPSAAVDGRLLDRFDGDEYADLDVEVRTGDRGDGIDGVRDRD